LSRHADPSLALRMTHVEVILRERSDRRIVVQHTDPSLALRMTHARMM
jgi:hypothetical protein